MSFDGGFCNMDYFGFGLIVEDIVFLDFQFQFCMGIQMIDLCLY